jgi:hypothetical protein
MPLDGDVDSNDQPCGTNGNGNDSSDDSDDPPSEAVTVVDVETAATSKKGDSNNRGAI